MLLVPSEGKRVSKQNLKAQSFLRWKGYVSLCRLVRWKWSEEQELFELQKICGTTTKMNKDVIAKKFQLEIRGIFCTSKHCCLVTSFHQACKSKQTFLFTKPSFKIKSEQLLKERLEVVAYSTRLDFLVFPPCIARFDLCITYLKTT